MNNIEESYPLSPMQQGMLFHHLYAPQAGVYIEQIIIGLREDLNVSAFGQAWQRVVERHPILRTSFRWESLNEPVQEVHQRISLPLPQQDWRGLPPGEQENRLKTYLQADRRRGFELTEAPLLRLMLFRVNEADYQCLWTFHHLLLDGRSFSIILKEVFAFYEAFCRGQDLQFKQPRPYRDYIEWMQQQDLSRAEDFWRQALKGFTAPTSLLVRRAFGNGDGQEEGYGKQEVRLSEATTSALQSLAQQHQLTLNTLVQGAWAILLSHYSGESDIVFGATRAGRHSTIAGAKSMVGLFINTLPVRVQFSPEEPLINWLKALRAQSIALRDAGREHTPLSKVQEWSEVSSGTPLFESILVFENYLLNAALRAQGGKWQQRQFQLFERTNYPLTGAGYAGEKLLLTIEYELARFDHETISRALEHWQTLLESIVTYPEQSLQSLPLPCLTETEQRQLLITRRNKLRELSPPDQTDKVTELTNLTRYQLQIWTGQKLQPEIPLYNLVDTFTIAGLVDREQFQKAFQVLIDNTDTLRTVIEEINGIPRQKTVANFPYLMEYLDFSQDPEPQISFQTWMRKRSQTLFDFEKCLFDSVLAKISENLFVWYLNIHHIIADGWSFQLIFQRMRMLYQSSLEGRLEETEAFPSFQDFIDYEQAYIDSLQYLEDELYWEQKLAQDVEPITFYGKTPLKRRPRVQRVAHNLGIERTRKLKALAMQEGFACKTLNVSLFNIFVGILSTYLYRISGNQYLSIGTPFLNRSSIFRETVGLFMQVVPLRIAISKDDTFASLIEKVQIESYETLQHQRYSSRIFQNSMQDVVFNYHNVSSYPDFYGSPVQEKWIHSGNDEITFSLHLRYPDAESFLLHFDFHGDVFSQEQQERAIQHFLQVLDAFLEDPSQPLSYVNLLSVEEKQRLLVEFNQTQETFPKEACIHQLFESQVECTPDSIAVVFEDKQLTYRELNRRANQLAHYLQTLGVGPDVPVGLCVERSPEMIIGILGILKAGGAYVPLDPAYPTERLTYMLQDAQSPVLLTQKQLAPLFSEYKAGVVHLDADWKIIARQSKENPTGKVTPGNLVYIIYTSGSTGKPKGVMIQHQSLVNFTNAAIAEYALESEDRVLQFASINFDASAEEIYPCLIIGATLVLRTDAMLSSVTLFLQKCREWRLTVLDLPTAYWHELTAAKLSTEALTLPESLRLVIIGGEAALADRVETWRQRVGKRVRLVNTYGPTEATIVSTVYDLSEAAERNASDVSIGRPISNVQVYVLNQELQPVPIGVAGELHIGGVSLARGYLNRPDLTIEKFISNPFASLFSPPTSEGGRGGDARLYKTGDLVRYRSDGNLEFLGRIDHQVKIRGYRIELGEIEAALGQHLAIRQAVVIAREDAPGDKRLVAYIVPHQQPPPPTNELRDFLIETLPGYMIPSAFVPLDTLPLTPNKKVDRRALPAPDQTDREPENTFVAARNEVERQLTEIWEKVLNIQPIGVRDDFFDLGGHSLLAIRLFAQIEKVFGKSLPLATLFQASTIEQLTSILYDENYLPPWSSSVPIQPGGSKRPFFCLGGGLALANLARHLGTDQPLYRLDLDPYSRFEDMAANCIKEIQKIQPTGPYLVGGFCFGGQVAFEMTRQLQAQGQKVALLAVFDTPAPQLKDSPSNNTSSGRSRLAQKIKYHIHHFLQLKPEDKLSYVMERTKNVWNQKIWRRIWTIGYNFYNHIDLPLPRILRDDDQAYTHALKIYNPQIYSGQVTIFRANDRYPWDDGDQRMGWDKLTIGDITVYHVPGDHEGIFEEPHVRVLAEKLRLSLQKAQETKPNIKAGVT